MLRLSDQRPFHPTDGIQCHAAHGYLLSEFLNPKVNRRTDAYGGAIQNRMRLLREIVSEIRQACGPNFAVSVKLNSSDFQKGGSTEDDNLEVLAMLENEAVDFVEISGGSYESPAMMGVLPRESTVKREAYFLEFAEKARKNLKIPLMVTGGFRTRAAMNDALASGACDLIGIGRPLCLHPSLPNELCTSVDPNYAVPTPIIDWNLVKPSERMFESIWHTMQIQRMSDGLDPDPTLKPGSAQGQIVRNLVFEPSLGFGTRWIWCVAFVIASSSPCAELISFDSPLFAKLGTQSGRLMHGVMRRGGVWLLWGRLGPRG